MLLGWCSCCGYPCPGMEPALYPGRVRLDVHLHPEVPAVCIGSGSVMRRLGQ